MAFSQSWESGKGANNLKEHSKPAHRLLRSPRKQPETIKAAGAAAEVGERGVVEWGGLLVYRCWLIG